MSKSILADLEELGDLLPDITAAPKSFPINDAEVLGTKRFHNLALKIIAEYSRRMKDALALYVPLPGPASAFHECNKRIRILSGGNQSGKTNTAEAEFARIARGKDPFKKRKDHDLLMLALGKDNDHVGQVMWKKLAWTGAFDVIRDEETGAWRSVRIDPLWVPGEPVRLDPYDLANRHLWFPSPPMIPEHEIDHSSWDNKAEGIPSMIKLKNGTEILFCTSNGAPRNGIQIDVGHFDEEIQSPQWLTEILPRLLRRGGLFFWSATPQASTPQFFALHRRVLEGDEDVAEFSLSVEDNPYLDEKSKAALRKDLLSMFGEEEFAVRWLGKYAIQGREVYPTYDVRKQGCGTFDVPEDWMLLVAIDPGTKVSAFVVFAVPPEANALYVVGECQVKSEDADGFAKHLKRYLNGRRPEAYVIDKRGGCQISMGRNDTVADHYSKAMQRHGVPPAVINGLGFVYGCDVPASRELSVKSLMNGGKLRFMNERLPHLDRQIRGRFYDKDDNTKREKRTVHDLCDCLEYGCAFFDDAGLYYNPPPRRIEVLTSYGQSVYASLQRKFKRNK
jgi:hypothetical protein